MNPSFLFFIPISLNYFLVIVKLCVPIVMLKKVGKRISGKFELHDFSNLPRFVIHEL